MIGARAVLVASVVLMAGACVSLQKRSVVQKAGDTEVRLSLPVFSLPFPAYNALLEEGSRSSRLLYTLFEQPMLLLPGPDPSTVLCVYNFDISHEVIAFDLDGLHGGSAEPEKGSKLGFIVSDSQIPFRHATVDEIRHALRRVERMTQEDFERASVPALDLGIYRAYVVKRYLVEYLEESLSAAIHELSPPQSSGSCSEEVPFTRVPPA